ncbi:MAG: hypothetical protein U0586_06925 [Candidatus Brocadiaceae bacterium]
MNKEQSINHAQGVGKVANLVIFLGILGLILSIVALTISQGLARRGYGFTYIILGFLMMGLGYGIRYRYKYCLYGAIGLFFGLSLYFLFLLISHYTSYFIVRLILCSWVFFRLVQSVSDMQILIATNSFPDRSNRFLKFFMRRRHL